MGEEPFKEACRLVGSWLNNELGEAQFMDIVKPFFNFLISKGRPETIQCIFHPIFKFLQLGKFCASEECRKILRTIFEKLSALAEPDFMGSGGNF